MAKRTRIALMLVCVAGLLALSFASCGVTTAFAEQSYEPGVVLAGVPKGLSADEVRERLTEASDLYVESVDLIAEDVARIVVGEDDQSFDEVLSTIAALDVVLSVQPNYVYAQSDANVKFESAPEESSGQAALDEESAATDTYTNLQWNLQSANVAPAWQSGITGAGVSVAIIDRGFDAGHPDLVGKYVGAYNVADGSATMGVNGHGLEVAGVITANQNNGYATTGVAPGARVVPITIPGGAYTSENLVKAYDYILRVRDQYNIRAVNMSFGHDWSQATGGDPLVCQKIDQAYAAGVVSVGSAGNNGGTVCHCPCDYGTTVGVMGLEYTDFDANTYTDFDESKVVRSSSSNYNGEGLFSKGIIAPGFKVPNIKMSDREGGYGLSWGTSYAAPHVCAALALMFEANPKMTSAQAVSVLYGTARDMGDAGWDAYHGYGALDIGAAVAAAESSSWLDGPQYVAVGEKTQFTDGSGSELEELEVLNGDGEASLNDGVGSVVAEQSGVLQLRALAMSGDELRAEVNAVGPIEGPDALEWGASGAYVVEQPYDFVYSWSVDGGEVQAISSSFIYVPNAGGEHTITATLVADSSVVLSKVVTVEEPPPGLVLYRSCVQGHGWEESWREDEWLSGEIGRSRYVEALQVTLDDQPYAGGVRYRSCALDRGWDREWSADGDVNGEPGSAEYLEAIQVELTGKLAKHYDVWYRVYVRSYGWLGWARNGERAGTLVSSLPLEGIEMCLLTKDQRPAASTADPFVA